MTLRVLSLGAGVQSSTLYLLAVEGLLGVMPEAAVFADTQWEPRAVYDHLARLEALGGARIPITRVSAGNLRTAALTVRATLTSRRVREVSVPLYVRNPDGSAGTLHRQCTRDYKLRPINRAIRELLNARGLRASPGIAESWIGISCDEATRMKPSRVRYIVNRWPLVELGMRREDCERWLAKRDIVAPKSACIACPYTNDARLRDRRDNDPESWSDAVAFDRAVRHLPEVNGECFVHSSLTPLDEVDFSTAEERGQTNLFENECEGLCGV